MICLAFSFSLLVFSISNAMEIPVFVADPWAAPADRGHEEYLDVGEICIPTRYLPEQYDRVKVVSLLQAIAECDRLELEANSYRPYSYPSYAELVLKTLAHYFVAKKEPQDLTSFLDQLWHWIHGLGRKDKGYSGELNDIVLPTRVNSHGCCATKNIVMLLCELHLSDDIILQSLSSWIRSYIGLFCIDYDSKEECHTITGPSRYVGNTKRFDHQYYCAGELHRYFRETNRLPLFKKAVAKNSGDKLFDVPRALITLPLNFFTIPFAAAHHVIACSHRENPCFYFRTLDNQRVCISRERMARKTLDEMEGSPASPMRVLFTKQELIVIISLARECEALRNLGRSRQEIYEYYLTHYGNHIIAFLERNNYSTVPTKLVTYLFGLSYFDLDEIFFLHDTIHKALIRTHDSHHKPFSPDRADSFLLGLNHESLGCSSLERMHRILIKKWGLKTINILNTALGNENMRSFEPAAVRRSFISPASDAPPRRMNPLIEQFKGWFHADLNPSKEAKRQMAFTFLHACKPWLFQREIMDERSWKDLELFCGQRDHVSEYLTAHIPTSTEVGKVFLMQKIAKSSVNVGSLRRDQARMQLLIRNSELFDRLTTAFNKLAACESGLFSFWDTQSQVLGCLNDMIFKYAGLESQSTCIHHACNWANANCEVLEVAEKWAAFRTALGSPLVMVVRTLLGLTGMAGAGEEPQLKRAKGPLDLALGVLDTMSVVRISLNLLNTFLSSDDFFSQINFELAFMGFTRACLRLKLILVANYFEAAQDIRGILIQMNEQDLFADYIEHLDFTGMPANTKSLQSILATDTFKGEACIPKDGGEAIHTFRYCTGRVIAACNILRKHKDELIPMISSLAELDVLLSSARLVKESHNGRQKFCFPTFVTDSERPCIDIYGSWNPLLARVPSPKPKVDPGITPEAVAAYFNSVSHVNPNDLRLNIGDKPRIAIITGPNAGGKTSIERGIVYAIIMAQGLGIAPAERLTLTAFHKILAYLNITDSQVEIISVQQDNDGSPDDSDSTKPKKSRSLFQAASNRAWEIYSSVRDLPSGTFALCMFDEVFNGTDSVDGQAAAYVLMEMLGRLPHTITIATTHFKPVMLLERAHPQDFKNYKVTVTMHDDGRLHYPYKLEEGTSDQHIAFNILENEGFDREFICRCRELADNIRRRPHDEI